MRSGGTVSTVGLRMARTLDCEALNQQLVRVERPDALEAVGKDRN